MVALVPAGRRYGRHVTLMRHAFCCGGSAARDRPSLLSGGCRARASEPPRPTRSPRRSRAAVAERGPRSSPADPPGPVTLPTTSAVHLWQSLEDRLLFRQAQELLSGLTGVTSDRAGSVFAAAAHALGLDVVGVARRFTRNLEHGHDDPDGPLVVRLVEMALSAGPVSESPAGPALPWAAADGSGEGEWTGRPESPLTLDVGAVPPGGLTVLSVGGELDLATAGSCGQRSARSAGRIRMPCRPAASSCCAWRP